MTFAAALPEVKLVPRAWGNCPGGVPGELLPIVHMSIRGRRKRFVATLLASHLPPVLGADACLCANQGNLQSILGSLQSRWQHACLMMKT